MKHLSLGTSTWHVTCSLVFVPCLLVSTGTFSQRKPSGFFESADGPGAMRFIGFRLAAFGSCVEVFRRSVVSKILSVKI